MTPYRDGLRLPCGHEWPDPLISQGHLAPEMLQPLSQARDEKGFFNQLLPCWRSQITEPRLVPIDPPASLGETERC